MKPLHNVGVCPGSGQRSRRTWALFAALTVWSAVWAQAQTAVSTLAGAALSSGSTNTATGPATDARFTSPYGVAVAGTSTLYVADAGNSKIRKIVLASGVTTDFVTGLATPSGVAVDGSGNVYVADTYNHVIRKYDSAGALQATYGTAASSGSSDSAPVKFNAPVAIAVKSDGSIIYVADAGNNLIRKIVTAGPTVTTIGGVLGSSTSTDGAAGVSTFKKPYGLALDAAGNLFVAERDNHAIRRIDTATNTSSTVAGNGTSGSANLGAFSQFNLPSGLAIDSSGTLYVGDTGNNVIRRILTPASTPDVSTLAGTALLGGNTDGLGAAARFQGPWGVAVDSAGTIYVADSTNQTIRRGAAALAPGVNNPGNATWTVGTSTSVTFTVAATGNPTPTVQWQRQPAGTTGFTNLANNATYSGVTSTTLTVSAATIANNGDQFRAVASNNVSPEATSNAATLTVNQVPAITSAAAATFTISSAGTFTVTSTGSPTPTYSVTAGTFPSWASLNSTSGLISGTPPDNTGSPFSFTVTASNGVGTAATQVITLTVQAGPSITVQPSSQSVTIGQNAVFAVTAGGSPAPTSYLWSRQAAGTTGFLPLLEGGGYTGTATATLTVASTTAAMNGDQFKVTISNGVGNTTSSAATLSATLAPSITSVATGYFVVGTPGTFTVTSTGSPAPTYSVTAGTFPVWASLNSTSGVISGTPTDTTGSPFSFTIQAANGVSPAATQAYTLTVSAAPLVPAFTTQPTNTTVNLGQNAILSAVVTGTPAPTFQWQRQAAGTTGFVTLTDGGAYSGSTTATLTISSTTSAMNNDQFLLVATNTSGTTNSTAVVLTISPGTVVTTLAGKVGVSGAVNATGTAATFNNPSSLVLDSAGNAYVADTTNHVIRKITSAGVVSVYAGLAGTAGSADGTTTEARFSGPTGLAIDAAGTIYVADSFNHTVRSISPLGVVTTLAGTAGAAGTVDGVGSAARFSYPTGVAVDAFGVYVADNGNHTIRRISANGTVGTLAGAATVRGFVDNATGTSARFAYPYAVAVDGQGNVYVADSLNHAIRKITQLGVVTTLAGLPAGIPGVGDGTGPAAAFYQPQGIATDSSGNVYVADTQSSTIRKITPAGVVTTVLGLPLNSGSADGLAAVARLNQPKGIAVDASGNLFIADTGNQTIRRTGVVSAPAITAQPANATAGPGANASFAVTATGAPTPSYQWQRQPAGTTGFVNLTNNGPYNGTTTATLTLTGVTSAMQGDQFRVLISNLISPDATSDAATLNTVTAIPAFTSANAATAVVGTALNFTVAATGTPTPTFSATGLPAWATLNATTGALTGTPTDASGSPITVTFTANNGISTTQTFTLTVLAVPGITTQPVAATVSAGGTATLSVEATGAAPLSYQWSRNGAVLQGATSATLSLANVQPASAGTYSVVVTNSAGTITSSSVAVVVTTAPVFASQPRSQTVLAGGSATLSVSATGSSSFTYQWRKNGVAIAGATSASLTLTNAAAADAANYDVVVTNSAGSVTSGVAFLSVSTGPVAPVVTAGPVSRTVVAGGSTTFAVSASAVPAPTYQWRRNGAVITGATDATLTLTGVASANAGNYDVVVTNSQGSVTSSAGSLRVIARSYAGAYFGSFGGSLGTFALYVRDDNSAVFLGILPGTPAALTGLDLQVSDAGSFTLSQPASAGVAATVSVTIGSNGSVTGTIQGGVSTTLGGSRAADVGSTQAVAGFYTSGAATSATIAYTITGADGQAFVVTRSATAVDGGSGAVNAAGQVAVTTARSSISQTITASSGALTSTSTGVVAATLTGANESVLASQRLANISSRARVSSGTGVVIGGFVVTGTESKPVLIRAVGPTLSGLGITGALSSPTVQLYRGDTLIATNTGVSTATNAAAIAAAGVRAGAFALGSSGADSAILATLAPGNYSAVVSSSNNTTGVALVEVYDLSGASAAQKLFNISTRAIAGTGESSLIAGVVVTGTASKRVLIRGVGPGLAAFGLTGTLPAPQLVLTKDGGEVARASNWSASADAAAITAASGQVGGFPLATGDAAIIMTLTPGNYTAYLSSTTNGTGLALIEIYELP